MIRLGFLSAHCDVTIFVFAQYLHRTPYRVRKILASSVHQDWSVAAV